MKAWGGALALALLLAVALPTDAVLAAQSAEDVLLDKANYWRIKDRPDLAAESLNKLLEINPNNTEALYQYGMLSVQQNKIADAQRYLTKLQQVAPDSPRVAELQNAIRTGSVGATDLREARRLAQAGQLDDAVKKYRDLFKGPPPSEYAVEYYMTLAGTAQGWDEARQGLEKASQQSPNDAQIKLSLAQLYTYREQTRVQGIKLLAELSKNSVVSAQAVQSWRQALTWLTGSPQQKAALQQYLAQFPNDQEMVQLLADLAKQPAGAGTAAQSQAYEDLKRGNTVAAERQFLADLKANPNDAQALAGLGLVRLRQQRFGEARDLLAKAIKLAPDQKKDFEPAYESAVFWGRVEEAKRLAAAKNYAGARAILRPLLAHPHGDQWGALLVLGDIESSAGDNAAAEAAYRQALRLHPGNINALYGLASALRAQNKTAEVDQMLSHMSPAERARFEKAGTGTGGGRAEALRNEAKAASANGDVATATSKFQAAIAADPKNPWIRLDYARFLAGQSHMPEAFAAVDPAASGNTPTSILVSAMFDAQQDRWVTALDKVNSIPVKQRTEDIKNFRDRIYVRGQIERAKQLAASGNAAQARTILTQLYQDHSVTTDERFQAPFVIVDSLHDYPTALQITRDVYVKGGPDSVRAGGDYAMLLIMQGGHDEEATKVMEQINASGLVNANNREQLAPVAIAVAVRRADKLRQHSDYAGAYDQISQLLVDNPDDGNLLMEVGRIYASAGRSKEAMEYFDKAYQQDSGNVEVIRGVVMGAILAHRLSEAQTYLDKGMEAEPNNPWFYYLKAQIAEARGNNGAAIQALRTARELNRQQNPGTTPAAADTTAPTPLAPGGTTGSPPPNPFRHSHLTLPGSVPAMMAAATGDPLGGGRSAQIVKGPRMKPTTSTVALGLLLSLAGPCGIALAATDPGEQVLLARAAFWRAQQRPDLAADTLNKVLALNASQPDALYQLGDLAVQRGDLSGAKVYFERLRQMATGDPHAAELVQILPQPGVQTSPTPPPPVQPAATVAAVTSPKPAAPPRAHSPVHSAPDLVAQSADSDDLTAASPVKPVRTSPVQMVSAPPPTVSDSVSTNTIASLTANQAGSDDLGIAARSVQLTQVELQPPLPVGGYLRPATPTVYSPTDTLEMDIDRNLAQLQQQSNPTLTGGLGFRWHDGVDGLNQLSEIGTPVEFSFSPWYTGTARIAVLPVYLDAGSVSAGNLGQFGANPILIANGLAPVSPRAQNASGVGLLAGYSYADFTGQIGTTPLGFPVTHLVGMLAYAPKFFDNTLTIRFEGVRQPVTDSLLSYAGTHASLTTANAITGGAFSSNTTWGGVVRTGGSVSAFYDDQIYGAYASGALVSLSGVNVPGNDEISGLLGAYFRPYKTDDNALRVGISAYYAGFNKNLSGFTFGQGGYFSPHNFEALTFPIEFTGHSGPWSYLASVAVGVQHDNVDLTPIFPYRAFAQSALASAGALAVTPGSTSTGPAINVKGQLEYAIDNSAALGVAVSFDNGNNYNEVIAKLYLRKTFDWFSSTASTDASAIAKRDQPQSHL